MNIKLDNKGMSLMELLIAVAIASVVSLLIVTMMTSSSTMFRRESEVIDVQNDLQVVQNQVRDALMEAKEISIVKSGDSVRIYTGAVDTATNKLTSEGNTGTECIITYKDDVLYLSNSYMTDIPKGYILSENVTDFDISIAGTPIEYTEEITDSNGNYVGSVDKEYYDNPISVDVTLKVGTGSNAKNADMTVKLRNKVKNFYVYNPEEFNAYLSGVTATEYELR